MFTPSPGRHRGLHFTIPSITGIYLIFWHPAAVRSHFKSLRASEKCKTRLFYITKKAIIEQAA